MTDTQGEFPRQFDGLELRWRLGESEEGESYRARDSNLDADVEVQVGASGTDEGLEHPFIRRTHRTGQVKGKPYAVLELVEGESLETLQDTHRVSLRRGLHILERVARAIDYAHGRDRVHKGLKAGDILVSEKDEPKVSGFKAKEEGDDPRDDIAALGVILKEFLDKDTAEELKRIAARCSDPDPELRYPTMIDLAEDLNLYLEGKPIKRPSISVAERLKQKIRRNRVPIAVGVAIAVVAVSLVIYFATRGEEGGPVDGSDTAKEQEAEDLILQARKLFEDPTAEGRIMEFFQKAIDIAPTARSYTVRAEYLLLKGREEQAKADLNKALEIRPKYGRAKMLLNKMRAAELLLEARAAPVSGRMAILDEAIGLDRKNAALFLERGRLFGQLTKYMEAIADLNTALTLNRHLDEAFILRDDFRARLAELRNPKKKKPERNRTELAGLQLELTNAISEDNWARVEELARDGLERGPEQPWMHSAIARAKLGQGKPEEAMPHADAAVKLKLENVDYLELRGDVYLGIGEARKAADDYSAALSNTSEINARIKMARELIKARPDEPLPHLKSGAYYYLKRNFDPAVENFTRAYQLGDTRALFWRAMAYHADGEIDPARADIEEFLQHHTLESAKQFLAEMR